jgi:hypothetical protein
MVKTKATFRQNWDKYLAATIVTLAVVVLSFSALRGLAQLCGFEGWTSYLWPLAIDATAYYGTRRWLTHDASYHFARALALTSIGVSIVANGGYHAMTAYHLSPHWTIVVLVGAIPSIALVPMIHLLVLDHVSVADDLVPLTDDLVPMAQDRLPSGTLDGSTVTTEVDLVPPGMPVANDLVPPGTSEDDLVPTGKRSCATVTQMANDLVPTVKPQVRALPLGTLDGSTVTDGKRSCTTDTVDAATVTTWQTSSSQLCQPGTMADDLVPPGNSQMLNCDSDGTNQAVNCDSGTEVVPLSSAGDRRAQVLALKRAQPDLPNSEISALTGASLRSVYRYLKAEERAS